MLLGLITMEVVRWLSPVPLLLKMQFGEQNTGSIAKIDLCRENRVIENCFALPLIKTNVKQYTVYLKKCNLNQNMFTIDLTFSI